MVVNAKSLTIALSCYVLILDHAAKMCKAKSVKQTNKQTAIDLFQMFLG